MMEKTHTPAPWFDVNYAGYIVIQSVEYYERGNDLLNEDKCKQAAANGKLTAAAPYLLAACEATLEAQTNKEVEAAKNLCLLAIRKALTTP